MNVWFIILIFMLIILCYILAYGWSVGAWSPIRQIRLLKMRHNNRHCYNCRYLGYNNECYAYKGRLKYDYTTGTKVMIGAEKVRYITDTIGTKYCKWKSAFKK